MAPTRTQRPTPSRKKSCLPCARSKVRCDLERPSCARCVASNRPCRYATADGPSSPAAPRHVVAPTSNATSASLSPIFTGPAEADYVEPCVTRQTPAPTQDVTPQTCHLISLNFSHLDLVPLADADQVRDRWLRPFLDVGDRVPKAFHPYTLQYMSCVLRTYPKQMAGDDVPPMIHPMQLSDGTPTALANCYSLVRLWHHRADGSEGIVAETVGREMDRLAQHVSPCYPTMSQSLIIQDPNAGNVDTLIAFQAYLAYSIMAYFSPISSSPLVNNATMVTLEEMAFRTAQGGLVLHSELNGTRPSWESWIVASVKRRAMFTFYLLSSVYNADSNFPNFLAEELQEVYAPDSKRVWEARSRQEWEREYARHLSLWPDGPLKISELWRSPDTGSTGRRQRIDRWVQGADEFGMMLFAVCVHLHGY
jgi:hypothetical protein